jgi:hypothetical protein
VKPGNILLTKEGYAKLGDFGLAYLGGGAKLTRAGMMVGSVAYMAPEVALGRQADARSDLYMLGASLYEMVTGRVPFPGDDPVRVLFSHINDLPLPPRRFAPDIPDALEALILKLLSKDPEQRPASAFEVLQALEEADVGAHSRAPLLAETVYQKTEGNSFFVEEVVRHLAESGAIALGERGWEVKDTTLMQLPDSVKAVIEERLERLGEDARGVLAWASVAGREFSLPLLKEVTGLDEDRLLDAIDKAEAARVLVPRPSLGQEAYAFVDNQTREALYEGISTARRRRYHLKVGQVLEMVEKALARKELLKA